MTSFWDVLGYIFLVVGVLFNLFGCIGLIRMPDVYNRLQAATKCVTLGTCSVLLGTAFICGGGNIVFKALICLAFVLVTSPTGAHALARGSYRYGIKLWGVREPVPDAYREAVKEEGGREVSETS